jgi:hypothetical protein
MPSAAALRTDFLARRTAGVPSGTDDQRRPMHPWRVGDTDAESGNPDDINGALVMREHNAEQGSNCLRTLNEAEIESVSGGKVKQTGEAYIPFVGTILWFDNGCASFMAEDWTVTHYC